MFTFKPDYQLEYKYPNRRKKNDFIGTKFCPRCKEDKAVEEFTTDIINGKKKLHGFCRICAKAVMILGRLERGLSVKSTSLFCVFKGYKHCTIHENQDEAIMHLDQFSKRHDFDKCQSGICLECAGKWHKDWRENWTKEQRKNHLAKEKESRLRQKEKFPDRAKNHTKNHRVKHRDRINKEARERMKNDPQFRLDRLMKSGISQDFKRRGLKKSGRKWLKMIPYTKEELLTHLQSTITVDMDFNDFFQGKLHLGHFPYPRELFRYTNPEDIEFQICWGLNNLKLQWAEENMSLIDRLPDGRLARGLTEEERMAMVQPLIEKYKAEQEEILLASRAY